LKHTVSMKRPAAEFGFQVVRGGVEEVYSEE
jgi:hypothetical protein